MQDANSLSSVTHNDPNSYFNITVCFCHLKILHFFNVNLIVTKDKIVMMYGFITLAD